ncbi:hypothetical protein ACLB2K_009959 [Fragaria x ananassa]
MVEISQLNDDLLGQILKWVSEPGDRKRVSEVCKQWLTVEGLTRTSLNLLRLSFLRQVLPRFPNLVTFETSELIEKEADLKFLAQTCRELEAIDLSTTKYSSRSLPTSGLCDLSSGGGLAKLSKLSVRGRQNVATDIWLHRVANLTYLDLGNCRVVDDNSVEAIGLLCTCLSYLNLERSNISNKGLRSLAHGSCSKTLETLVLAECCRINDSGISHLQNMQCLEELDLESCGCGYRNDVTDVGVIAATSGNRSLKKLNLSWLRNVSDQSMVFLAENCPSLEILDVSGCCVTGAGIRALSSHRCLKTLVLGISPKVSFRWPDVEHLVLGCHSLRSIVLPNKIKATIPDSLSRIVTFVDDY